MTPIERRGGRRGLRPPPGGRGRRRRGRPAAAADGTGGAALRRASAASAIRRAASSTRATLAWQALNRRERTEAELPRAPARKRVEPERVEEVVGELRERRLSSTTPASPQRFAEDRRRLDGWGAERIERRLRALGVDREHVAAALGERGRRTTSSTAALALLARRFPSRRSTPRERDRALGILVRKGYGLELAHDALRRHAGVERSDN